MKGDFRRYLTAKETVDSRAFAPDVRRRVRDDLRGRPDRVRLLDAGAGTGPFLRRLLRWPGLADVTYAAVDVDRDTLELARDRTARAARERGYAVDSVARPSFDVPGETVAALSFRGENAVDALFVHGDALDAADAGGWSVVVAQAFVDLLDATGVDRLLDGLAPGGRFYFPITFDGGTSFSPSHESDADVLAAYHETMRDESGDRLGAQAGRRLERHLDARGVEYAADDADWHVRPRGDGYPADEAYFLRVVVDTVADAVRGGVPDETRRAWHRARRRALESNDLRYAAANRDVTGVVP